MIEVTACRCGCSQIEGRVVYSFATDTECRVRALVRGVVSGTVLDDLGLYLRLSSKHFHRWQPIETAPKDGTTVLLWLSPKNGLAHHAVSGEWICGAWRRGDDRIDEVSPTHWAPLDVPEEGD